MCQGYVTIHIYCIENSDIESSEFCTCGHI